jgi:hypothetical protein
MVTSKFTPELFHQCLAEKISVGCALASAKMTAEAEQKQFCLRLSQRND